MRRARNDSRVPYQTYNVLTCTWKHAAASWFTRWRTHSRDSHQARSEITMPITFGSCDLWSFGPPASSSTDTVSTGGKEPLSCEEDHMRVHNACYRRSYRKCKHFRPIRSMNVCALHAANRGGGVGVSFAPPHSTCQKHSPCTFQYSFEKSHSFVSTSPVFLMTQTHMLQS